ncbi:Hypothetical protein NTJ_05924 [Nesidiocoris tenuis]|uniref:Uncharacterized protein n=1 Tax=Nesidiocoris tenuis TaxID=355587 RepID=A0ABN7ALL7_9HEMI|nr:Hypothetical protein NTJ_05924 [Nesidiocoris tenuis]
MKAVAILALLAILFQVAQVRTQDEETYSSQNDSSAAQEDSNDSDSADDNEQSGPVSEADSAPSARTLRSNVLSPLVLQGASSIWSPSARQIASPTNANPSNALLNVLSGLLNSPKGNLGKLPLCNLKQLTGVSSGVNTPPSQLNLRRLQSLIALLSNSQALRPCVKFPRTEFIPQPLNPYLPFIPSNPQTFPVPQCNIPGLCEQTSNTNINQIGGPTPVNGPVSCGEDSFIKHVPVVQKIIRQVIETRTRHVPVIKKRIRTVVEPYTSHVPVLEKFARPVEDTIVRTVPVVQKINRPCINPNPNFRPFLPQQLPSIRSPQIIEDSVDQFQIQSQSRLRNTINPCPPGYSPRSEPIQFSIPQQSSPSFSFQHSQSRQTIEPISINHSPQSQSFRCPSPAPVYDCSR